MNRQWIIKMVAATSLLITAAGCASPADQGDNAEDDSSQSEDAITGTPGQARSQRDRERQEAIDKPYVDFVQRAYLAAGVDDFAPRDPSALKPNAARVLKARIEQSPNLPPKVWHWAPQGSPSGAKFIVLESGAGLKTLDIFIEGEDRQLLRCRFVHPKDVFARCS